MHDLFEFITIFLAFFTSNFQYVSMVLIFDVFTVSIFYFFILKFSDFPIFEVSIIGFLWFSGCR